MQTRTTTPVVAPTRTPTSTTDRPRRTARRLVGTVMAATLVGAGLAATSPAQAASLSPESMSQRVAKKATRTWTAVPSKRTLGKTSGIALKAGVARSARLAKHPKVPAGTRSLVVRVTVTGATKPGTLSVWTPGRTGIERTTVAYGVGTTKDKVRITATVNGRIRLEASSKVRVKISTIGYKKKIGKPSAANTGVPAGTKLKVHQGDLTITKAGTVVDGLDVRGFVRIKANDVTIRNTIVRGRPTSNDMHLVQASYHTKRTVIVDSELAASHPSPHIKGIVGDNFTLLRTNIHDVVDQVSIIGDNVLIEDSWLHDNLYYLKDPVYGGTPTHDDNIQISVGTNLRFTGNRMEDTHNAAVMITQDRGHVSDTRLEANWINGGACSINIAEKRFGPLKKIAVTGNKFGTNTRHAHCALLVPSTTKVTQHRNSFTDDRAFRPSKG